jgi:hypothetical protein
MFNKVCILLVKGTLILSKCTVQQQQQQQQKRNDVTAYKLTELKRFFSFLFHILL